MRVLNVMLSKGRGGIEVAFANYALALQDAGVEVTSVVTPGAEIRSTLPGRIVELANRSQFDPFALLRATWLVFRERPDVVIAHGRRAFLIFGLAARLFGKHAPLVQVLHRPRFKNLSLADHVITVSEDLRQQVLAHGGTRVTHVPNFLPRLANASPLAWQSPPVIGLLSRFVPVKGVDLFLEALALLKQRGVTCRVKIGGIGPDEAALKAQAVKLGVDSIIEWFGWVNGSDAFYQSIDVFCLPSRAESFGLVVIEAFAQGKLVVSTATSGPSEIIVDGVNGVLCAVDAAAIADALEAVLKRPDMAEAMVTRALLDKEKYTMAAVAPQIMHCLRSAMREFSGAVVPVFRD